MLTPGATSSGKVVCGSPHAEGPRALSVEMTSFASVEPTANAAGLFAGLGLVEEFGPKFPAANTGRMPAARRLTRSCWKVRSQPGLEKVHESLTTLGASGVLGLPSGSRSH